MNIKVEVKSFSVILQVISLLWSPFSDGYKTDFGNFSVQSFDLGEICFFGCETHRP